MALLPEAVCGRGAGKVDVTEVAAAPTK